MPRRSVPKAVIEKARGAPNSRSRSTGWKRKLVEKDGVLQQ